MNTTINQKYSCMLKETQIYSNFIKENKIIDYFVFNDINIPLNKDSDGKYYADNDDKCHTKKASIYYYIKNHSK